MYTRVATSIWTTSYSCNRTTLFLLKISANRDPTEHSQHHKDITQDYNDILKNHITKLDYTRFYLNEFYLAQILFIFCYDVSEKQ